MGGVIIVNLVCTLMLTGIIWFVQVVHYPLFQKVGRDQFRVYEKSHQRLTSWVVAPLMIGELTSAIVLTIMSIDGISGFHIWLNLVLVLLIWLVTFSIQVPLHNKLSGGYIEDSARRLVMSNAIRTILWNAKATVLILLLFEYVP